MDEKFEGCEHIVGELYEYALSHNVAGCIVEDKILHAYFEHQRRYDGLADGGAGDYDLRLRDLNAHVLGHVMSDLEKFVEGKRFP